MAELDELDEKILKAMARGIGVGARPTELARELSKSRSTVNLRVETLEEKGVITGYTPEIDWEKLGYGMVGYMGIICPEDVMNSLLRVLKADDSVSDIWEITTGTFDILAKCKFRNYREINDLRKRIRRVNGVKDVDIYLLGPCHKEE
jgi:DNA-binding Lrp family transcriptional regulator